MNPKYPYVMIYQSHLKSWPKWGVVSAGMQTEWVNSRRRAINIAAGRFGVDETKVKVEVLRDAEPFKLKVTLLT